ncbi:MAG: tetratricopeptide repeat protein [Acidobacteriaceae bacterium]|nr:tetratricopeptide repeat protein [Acidobacteriaceae bacterium]
MRGVITILLAACFPALAQADRTGDLESILAAARDAQAAGDFHTAADRYRQAIALRSDIPELWSNLGLMQYQCRDYPKAEQALRHAVGMNKSLFVPNLFLGLDLLELKRARDAVPFLLAAQKLNAQDTEPLLALGRAYHMLSDAAQSRDWYQRATELSPRKGEAWYGLGVADMGLAEAASSKLLRLFPKSIYVSALTAEALAGQGKLDESIRAYQELLLSKQPLPPCARTSYGNVLLRAGKRAEADEQFAQDRDSCRDDGPSPAPQHANNAESLYLAVRSYQKSSVAALTRASEVEPDSPRIHALLGDIYQRRKLYREAEQEYSKLLALSPDNLAGLTGLAAAHFADGHLDEAQAAARKAFERDASDIDVNVLMAEILVARHEYAESEPYLQRSLRARPEMLPRVHALLGRVYARTGREKEAIHELMQGLSSDDDGSVYYQLARLYQKAGDAKAASAAFEKSRQIRSKRDASSQQAFVPVQ